LLAKAVLFVHLSHQSDLVSRPKVSLSEIIFTGFYGISSPTAQVFPYSSPPMGANTHGSFLQYLARQQTSQFKPIFSIQDLIMITCLIFGQIGLEVIFL